MATDSNDDGRPAVARVDPARWARASPLLDELLDLDAPARAARLDALRAADPVLADEVGALLAAQTQIERGAFLEGAAVPAPVPTTLAGRAIGAYTLERELGVGGMGTVWLGRRHDGRFDGAVAIKLPNLALLNRGGAERFAREGSVLGRLSHPHIARLLDAGVADNQPYLVLEYVDGLPIDRWCDQHALGVRARLRLMLDVLSAVEHAHANLVLHRDLKPSNILVDTAGRVKLLDFGVAKLLADVTGATASTELTLEAGRAFTPDFAAPEQVRGEPVSTATDVYALGVLMYVLLGGRHPTALPTAAPLERLRAALETEPPTLSQVAQRTSADTAAARATTAVRLARDLRGDLDNVVAKALKKPVAERYPTATALAADLRRYLAHEPVSARPDSLGYRTTKFVRRYRLAVGAASATLLALVAGVVGTSWQAWEAQRQRDLAQASAREAQVQRAAADFEARVARANHEFVSQLFGDAMRDAQAEQMNQRLDRARELLRLRFPDDPVVHATVLFQLAGRYAELREREREDDVIREVEALAQRSGDAALQTALQCVRAYDELEAGNTAAARPRVVEAMKRLAEMPSALQATRFECFRADAMLATADGDAARGIARMQALLADMERAGLHRTRGYLSTLGSLSHVHLLADDLVGALDVTRRARALNEVLGSQLTVSAQNDLQREAALLFQLGRVADAIQVNRELLQRFDTMGSGVPPVFLTAPAQHAMAGGDSAAAIDLLQRVQPHFERNGPEAYARGIPLDLALAFAATRKAAAARAQLARYAARLPRGPASPRQQIAAAQAAVEIALIDPQAAALRAAATALEAALVDQSRPRVVVIQARLTAGRAWLALGDADRARAQVNVARGLAEEKRMAGRGSAWLGAAELALSLIAASHSQHDVARRHAQAAATQFEDSLPAAHPWHATVRGQLAAR